MQNILFIALGGAIGAVLRYLVTLTVNQWSQGYIPYGTISVNLLGSLIIGLLWGILSMETLPAATKQFLFIGILGAFTTFSTFSMENVLLLESGATKAAILNILISNIGGLALAFGGYQAGKWLGA